MPSLTQSVALLLLSIGLAACGKDIEVTNPAPQTPVEVVAQTLQQKLSLARSMGVDAPDPTPRHYYMRGHINFVLEDPNADIIEQGLDLYVGGPDRMKLILRTTGRQQVFFLADAKNAWLRLPDAKKATEYDSDELSQDSILRWMILQFPWSATDMVEWPQLSADELAQLSKWPSLTLTEPGSTTPRWIVNFDRHGLPLTVSTPAEPDWPILELSDWQAGSSGQLFPGVWAWRKEWGTLEEHFEAIADESLFLDRLFVPSTHREGTAFFAGISGSLSPLRSAEQIGVAAIELHWLEQTVYQNMENKPKARGWWRHVQDQPGSVVYLLDDVNEVQDASIIQSSNADMEWLRWRTFKQLKASEARKTLNQIAERSGLAPTGEMMIRQPKDSDGEGERIYLLAVRKNEAE